MDSEDRQGQRVNCVLPLLIFGPPHTPLTFWMSRITRYLEETADNLDGLLPAFLAESGFAAIVETDHLTTIVGPLSLYRAVKTAGGVG